MTPPLICPLDFHSPNPLQKQPPKQQQQQPSSSSSSSHGGCFPCFFLRSKPSSPSPHHNHDHDSLYHDLLPPFRQHPPVSSAHLRPIVWREGLLHSLGRLHSSGNCKLSLGELIDLDEDPCLDNHLIHSSRDWSKHCSSSSSNSSRSSSFAAKISRGGEQECVVVATHTNYLYETNWSEKCEITEYR